MASYSPCEDSLIYWMMGNGVMRATLTFDLDDVEDIGEFKVFVQGVMAEFDNVWVRRSSSGEGFHLKISEVPEFDTSTGKLVIKDRLFDASQAMDIRTESEQECRGRLTGDRGRLQAGLQVGRLFVVKSGKVAGEWVPAEAFIVDETILEMGK